MKRIDIQLSSKVVNADLETRQATLMELSKALKLNGYAEAFDMHKAAKGERITSPHLNPIIWELEKEFYALWDAEKIIQAILVDTGIAGPRFSLSKAKKAEALYKANGEPLTDKEMERLEEILMNALHVDRAKVHKIIVQSAAAAKMSGGEIMGQLIQIDLSKLPKDLREAILLLKLNPIEVNAIKFAYQYAGEHITGVTNRAKGQIKNIILEALQARTPRRQLATKLMREMAVAPNSVLNRDWERVAITEANRSASDGFIASQPEGGYVLGNSHDDACQYCFKQIDKKIYRVTHKPPPSPEGLDPRSKKYREVAERWENEVWVGKSNVGRGLSGRKIEDHKMRGREHHERAMPVLPLHPYCLPGDSLVSPRGSITGVSKRWYDGNMIILKSASGRVLTCTPNHPVLTNRGFLPADSLDVGSTVISDGISERAFLSDGDDIDKPSRIKDIVESFLNYAEMMPRPVPMPAKYLHADRVSSEITIIGANRFLRDGLNAPGIKHSPKENFVTTNICEVIFNRASTFYLRLQGYFTALRSFMGRPSLIGTLFSSHVSPFNLFGLRLSPEFNTGHFEPRSDGGARDAELFGQGIDGDTGSVKIKNLSNRQVEPKVIDRILSSEILSGEKGVFSRDRVIHIEVIPFKGYVYNIETTEGYYVANGITTHNCRCRWSVWIPDLYYLKNGRVEFAVDDKTKAEQAEWLKGNPHIQIGGR